MKIGVDLSAWNKLSNIKKAKENGLDFVIIKSGSGITKLDSKFNEIYSQCKNCKMPVGTYWYLYAKTIGEAEREARQFLENIKGKEFEYPLWLDFEDPSQKNISKKLKTEIAIVFMSLVEKQGYYIGIYSMGSWLKNEFDYNLGYNGKKLGDFDQWVAHWTYSKDKKSPFVSSNTGIWQYSNKGSFIGIGMAGKELDMNIALKDYETIIKTSKLNGFKDRPAEKDYIIISKIENIKSEEWINILRKNLKDKYFIVETCSGYFDYSLVKTRKILGIGGKPSQHTSYLTHFITEEELGKISENNIINSIDKYKI